MAPFDQAMLFASRNGAGQVKYGQPYLARGKRFAALSRFDEAEADFNQAVELAPKDREVLVARARFQVRPRRAEQAATDLNAAFAISREQQLGTYPWCNAIDLEFLQNPEVAERMAALQPERPSRLSTHLFLRRQSGDTAQAKADLAQLRSRDASTMRGSMPCSWATATAYEEICREAVETNFEPGGRLWLLLLGEPTCVAPADVLVLAQQVETTAEGTARSAIPRTGSVPSRSIPGCGRDPDRRYRSQRLVAARRPVLVDPGHGPSSARQRRTGAEMARSCGLDLDLLQRNGLQPQAFRSAQRHDRRYATAILAHREAKALIEGTADPTRPPSASPPE